VIAGHRSRRAAMTSGIQQQAFHICSSLVVDRTSRSSRRDPAPGAATPREAQAAAAGVLAHLLSTRRVTQPRVAAQTRNARPAGKIGASP
jgi:hypothetical protein